MLGFSVVLMGILVTATTVITDKGITFDQGNIISLANITLGNQPLFIRGGDNDDIRAIFNGNSSIVLISAQDVNASTSTTSFLGDVDNFDNVNAFSRFKETNLNNGTNASAGFIGINDVGFRLSIGIASSNFEFDGSPTPNIGALRLGSPATMLFLNDFTTGWSWITDLNNTVGFQDPFTVMDVDPNGNFEIFGNFTGTQFYLEGSFFNPTSTQVVTPTAILTPAPISFTENKTNGFFHTDNQNFTALVNGTYRVFYSVSYLDGASQTHVFAVANNNIFQNSTGSFSSTSNANHVATPTGGGIIQVVAGDNLTVVTMDLGGPVNAISVGAANFNAVRVGD